MAYTQITTLLHAFSPMNSEPTRNKCVLPEAPVREKTSQQP